MDRPGGLQPELAPAAAAPPKWLANLVKTLRAAMQAGRSLYGASIRSPQDFFVAVDKDGSGQVERAELQSALDRLGPGLSAADFEQLYGWMDNDGSGRLSYREFLQHLMPGTGAAAAAAAPPLPSPSRRSERQMQAAQKQLDAEKGDPSGIGRAADTYRLATYFDPSAGADEADAIKTWAGFNAVYPGGGGGGGSIGGAAVPPAELRIDPKDMYAKTREQFVAQYKGHAVPGRPGGGAAGEAAALRRWDEATKMAGPGSQGQGGQGGLDDAALTRWFLVCRHEATVARDEAIRAHREVERQAELEAETAELLGQVQKQRVVQAERLAWKIDAAFKKRARLAFPGLPGTTEHGGERKLDVAGLAGLLGELQPELRAAAPGHRLAGMSSLAAAEEIMHGKVEGARRIDADGGTKTQPEFEAAHGTARWAAAWDAAPRAKAYGKLVSTGYGKKCDNGGARSSWPTFLDFEGFYAALVRQHNLAAASYDADGRPVSGLLCALLAQAEAALAARAKAAARRLAAAAAAGARGRGASIEAFTILTPHAPRPGQVQRPISDPPAHQQREKHEATHRMPDGRKYEYAFGSSQPTPWEVHLEAEKHKAGGKALVKWEAVGTASLPVGPPKARLPEGSKGVTVPKSAQRVPKLAPAPPPDRSRPLPPRIAASAAAA
eukprot:SAG22_NODE_2375_length_2643_cov_1.666274_1_plen_665_part_10